MARMGFLWYTPSLPPWQGQDSQPSTVQPATGSCLHVWAHWPHLLHTAGKDSGLSRKKGNARQQGAGKWGLRGQGSRPTECSR